MARKLNYLNQLSADTVNHVITYIKLITPTIKDNQQLPDILKRLKATLVTTRAGFGELCGRHRLQLRRELCIFRASDNQEL